MKTFTMQTKIIVLSLLILVAANINMFVDYWAGEEHALIREMRLEGTPKFGKYQHKLDEVVLKHIPFGTPANAARDICQKNGFTINEYSAMSKQHGALHPGMDEYMHCYLKETRWYLIGFDDYQVLVYLKGKAVGDAEGLYFARTLGY